MNEILIHKHQVSFEDACDFIYNGKSYERWLKCEREAGEIITDEDAQELWGCAVNYMSNYDNDL